MNLLREALIPIVSFFWSSMKYLICILSIICISIGLSYSQEKTSTDTSGTFIDNRDGHVYKWVKIGTQIWMAENLTYDAGSGSWNYFNDPAYATYGRLYDWETAKKACPAGWHLPDDSEWTILTDYVGGVKRRIDLRGKSACSFTSCRGKDEDRRYNLLEISQ